MLIIAAVIIVLAAVILCIALGVFDRTGLFRSDETAAESGTEGWTSERSNPNAIVYDGKTYVYNDHLTNYLLLGVDTAMIVSRRQLSAWQSPVIPSRRSRNLHPEGTLWDFIRII